jgi:lipoprotein LpqB-like beta-propeller protein/sporulation and spore germination protein
MREGPGARPPLLGRVCARRLRPARMAVAAALLGLLASGCAAIPSSGTPQSAPTPPPLGGAGVPDCCRTVLRGPQPNWTAQQVVKGFLTASASLANDHALARSYLTKQANQAWRPGNEVTILASAPSVSRSLFGASAPGGKQVVIVTGKKLATLKDSGQYIPSTGGDTTAPFSLELVNGRLLIDGLPSPNATPAHPSRQLLLPSDLFHLVYTPRNLYFYGIRNNALVPDPVFVPNEVTNPATKLIGDLVAGPSGGLLDNAAQTDFPRGIDRPKLQVLPSPTGGKVAIVSFRLPASVTDTEKLAMARQLVATLTSSAYSPALFRAVKFKINGRFWAPPSGDPLLELGSLPGGEQLQRSGAPLYYLTSTGTPKILGSKNTRGIALSSAETTLKTIAVSPSGKYFAGVGPPGNTIYSSSLSTTGESKSGEHPATLHLHAELSGIRLASLSWDNQNDLWVAGQRKRGWGVWVLRGGHGPAIRVMVVPGQGPGGDVTGIRIAPDGVRAAMIIGHGPAARLVLGSIVHDAKYSFTILRVVPLGSGLSGVTSVSWYDEDHLLAVSAAEGKAGQSSVSEVPANGDSARLLTGQSGSTAITTAGPRNPLYLSLSTGRVEKSVGLDEPWTFIAAGRAATYPG